MTKEIYHILESYMLSCMGDSAHDKEHIYRVLYNALEIAKTENDVDYDVLITACLLHDVGRREQFENPALCHAMVGSKKAYQFLMEHGFEEGYAEKVRQCIQTHRYRKDNLPQSLEAKICLMQINWTRQGQWESQEHYFIKVVLRNLCIHCHRMEMFRMGKMILHLLFFKSISIN